MSAPGSRVSRPTRRPVIAQSEVSMVTWALLNPRWAQAMAAMGSGGAYEISQRMTALIGWGGTSGFQDPWVYDQAADTYALDPAMAQRLREANPEAFRNVVGRMLEAHSRGMWKAPADKIDKLRNLYDLTDAELEGVTVATGT